jgi:uncharacterized protein (UPF0333 family)
MELIVFLAVGLAIIYVLYKTYGPKDSTPAVTVAEVVAKAETVVAEVKAEAKPAKKTAAKKPTVKKATTRKPKAK